MFTEKLKAIQRHLVQNLILPTFISKNTSIKATM